MLKHAPYRDIPVGTSAVEMVMDDELVDDEGVFLGDDDPEMLSDFDDDETDDFLLPNSNSSPPKVSSESSQRAIGMDLSQTASSSSSSPPSSHSASGSGSAPKWGSMTCSYCLNILYVPAMFGM